MSTLKPNTRVLHPQLGEGLLIADMGDVAVIRFAKKVEVCAKAQLQIMPSAEDLLLQKQFSDPLSTIAHFQAACICSANDKWGIFGRSKIDLLPHQMWVCRKAKSKAPCRLLVADDVGLGKTIEAGIILSSFLGNGKVRRLLILTPASLVRQWQTRMFDMFDIRLMEYSSDLDTPNNRFWQTTDSVVASFHTLRLDRNGRMERFLDVEPWDLIIVDEAHHLNKEKKQGATLGHSLIQKMNERELTRDMIFFTGTPHRGKDYGFYSLMHLLSPEFDPDKPKEEQLQLLHDYMVRNNKYNVTDLYGNRLFEEPDVESTTYAYSEEETAFYERMTLFIANGKAYANTLSKSSGSAVMLVLIAMQKLASSSVAAIRHALTNRYKKLEEQSRNAKNATNGKMEEFHDSLHRVTENEADPENADLLAVAEAELVENTSSLKLVENEQAALADLLQHANAIADETKIHTILNVLETEYPDENILFFTEYKATQKLLLEALMKRYGENSTTIINGDERLDQVAYPDGSSRRLTVRRMEAAELFNCGKRRFLIATEAAGEGIDLQANCHILFHVDLPWNPMRLHQRVGRLNRYGQKCRVMVRNFRNPDTVESHIWDKLNDKIAEINRVFGAVMEENEDLFQLVLGMTPQTLFRDLFAEAPMNVSEEKLTQWYDAKTATFGGKEIYKAVQELVGNASKFNYRQLSTHLPTADLPDLVPFFKNMFSYNHKRLSFNGRSYEFQVPDCWKSFGIRSEYQNQVFLRDPEKGENVIGVGFKVFDKALNQALKLKGRLCCNAGVEAPLLIWSVHDQLTDHSGEKQASFYGVLLTKDFKIAEILPDWKLLKFLNERKWGNGTETCSCAIPLECLEKEVQEQITRKLAEEEFRPAQPVFILEGILLP